MFFISLSHFFVYFITFNNYRFYAQVLRHLNNDRVFRILSFVTISIALQKNFRERCYLLIERWSWFECHNQSTEN